MDKLIRPRKPEWWDKFIERNKNNKVAIKNRLIEIGFLFNYKCAYSNITTQDFEAELLIFNTSLGYAWENIFYVHKNIYACFKEDTWKKVLRPDAEDYSFERYFKIIDAMGNISIQNNISDIEKKLALNTINLLKLNDDYILRDLKEKYEGEIPTIKNISYSDFNLSISLYKAVAKSLNYNERYFFLCSFLIEELNNYIENILIEQYFSIYNIDINIPKKSKEIYFFGENGVGKTLLLQAISLTLSNENIQFIHKYLDNDDENKINIFVKCEDDNFFIFNHYITNYSKNIFAYGIHRFRNKGKEPDEHGYLSLFDSESFLIEPEQFLKELQRKSLLGKTQLSLEKAMKLLGELLDDLISITYNEATDRFEYSERGTPLEFHQLSDGFKSNMIWLSDLLFRLMTQQPEVSALEDYKAVVLVDEIGALQHPTWEFTFVRNLRKKFPKIQWFFTSHSPIVAMGASEDAVFFKLWKEEGKTKISEAFNASDFLNQTLNGFISSPLFNLEAIFPAGHQNDKNDLQTGNYIYDLVHQAAKKELQENPPQNLETLKTKISELLAQAKGKWNHEKNQ